MTIAKKLWLIRHAKPLIAPGICYGAADIIADREHTHNTAKLLAVAIGQNVPVWTSERFRTQQLATMLKLHRPDLSLLDSDARLNEFNYGRFELMAWDDIPQADYDQWNADFRNFAFGGEESVAQLITRVQSALHEVRQSSQPEVVWVTHAGVIRAVKYLQHYSSVADLSPETWPRSTTNYGEWKTISLPPLESNQPLHTVY